MSEFEQIITATRPRGVMAPEKIRCRDQIRPMKRVSGEWAAGVKKKLAMGSLGKLTEKFEAGRGRNRVGRLPPVAEGHGDGFFWRRHGPISHRSPSACYVTVRVLYEKYKFQFVSRRIPNGALWLCNARGHCFVP